MIRKVNQNASMSRSHTDKSIARLIYVDGYNACGKSILLGLLDGSPQTFIAPIQDSIINAFADCPYLESILENRDLALMRKMLIEYSNFYIIEQYSAKGRIRHECSRSDFWYPDFNFDFQAFETALLSYLRSRNVWTVAETIMKIYSLMPVSWPACYLNPSDCSKYVAWGLSSTGGISLVLSEFTDARVISMRRSAIDILASRLSRSPNPDNYRSKYRLSTGFWDYINSNIISQIQKRDSVVDQLKQQYPGRLKIVEFDELINNTSTIMEDVYGFLSIDPPPSGINYSFNGNQAPPAFQNKALAAINDTSSLLSPSERLVVELESGCNILPVLRSHPNLTLKWYLMRRVKNRSSRAIINYIIRVYHAIIRKLKWNSECAM